MSCNSFLDPTNLKVKWLHLKYFDMIVKAKDPVRVTHTFFSTRSINFMYLVISRAQINSESTEVGNLNSQLYIDLPLEGRSAELHETRVQVDL